MFPAQVQVKLATQALVKQMKIRLVRQNQVVQIRPQRRLEVLVVKSIWVVSSAGVAVQRSASRVSYNQSAIDDSNNSAWDFADGVLEQILATSRSRGYITGNQYILERVNIVNGNGYYNLYKPDGTYLFTLNCKTGYFVGNGSGHADDLDY